MVIKKREILTYVILWLLAIVLYLGHIIDDNMSHGATIFSIQDMFWMIVVFFPFVLIFLINNYMLIPRYYFKRKMCKYLIGIGVLIIFLVGYDYLFFVPHSQYHMRVLGIEPSTMEMIMPDYDVLHHRHWLPMPLINNVLYAVLVVGGNLSISLTSRTMSYELERERLINMNMENRLEQLKMQINPHFYMNMINSIHGMIEIDPMKAQDMMFDMSQLMRYMLYDSGNSEVQLGKEVRFLKDYLKVMRQRCPEEKVKITSEFPEEAEMHNIKIPPLLFLVFIENAFKHGVTFRSESYINVKISITSEEIIFLCENSKRAKEENNGKSPGGIGLKNIRQRLELLYSGKAELNIEETENKYNVQLTIPKK